jgi:ubiquinone/menaquinone biosynthesis C-methylase UbiE
VSVHDGFIQRLQVVFRLATVSRETLTVQNLRTAHAYDRNKYHPPEVSGKIASAITESFERQKNAEEPHILEIGTGTGRIGMPIIARGFRFTGVDLDPDMMAVFRAKYGGISRKVSLIEADAQDLPFDDHSFDAAIAVHVWDLIPNLEKALAETLRVVRPGGFLFEGWEAPTNESEELLLRDIWINALVQRGMPDHRMGQRVALEKSAQFLRERGLHSQEAIVATWDVHQSPMDVIEALQDGVYSFAKNIPLEHRYAAARDVKEFLGTHYADLEAPVRVPWSFRLRSTRLSQVA